VGSNISEKGEGEALLLKMTSDNHRGERAGAAPIKKRSRRKASSFRTELTDPPLNCGIREEYKPFILKKKGTLIAGQRQEKFAGRSKKSGLVEVLKNLPGLTNQERGETPRGKKKGTALLRGG